MHAHAQQQQVQQQQVIQRLQQSLAVCEKDVDTYKCASVRHAAIVEGVKKECMEVQGVKK